MAYVPRLTPKSWQEKNNDNLKSGFNLIATAEGMDDNLVPLRDPEYDYLKQAEAFQHRAQNSTDKIALTRALATQKALNKVPGPKFNIIPEKIQRPKQAPVARPKGGKVPAQQNKNARLQAFINAISGQESGGNYGAVNPDSGAAGKYQIMPANFVNKGGWDYDALGKDITLQEYMANPKIQEKIAQHKLTEYYRKYGPGKAASAWYSGNPENWNSQASQGAYPSINEYVRDILHKMGLL